MPAMNLPNVQYLKRFGRFLGYAIGLYYQYNEVWRLLKLKKNYVIIDGIVYDKTTNKPIVDPKTKKEKYYEYVELYRLPLGNLINSVHPGNPEKDPITGRYGEGGELQ